jgi:hypothetical protein
MRENSRDQPTQPLIIDAGLDRGLPSTLGATPFVESFLYEFREEIRCNFRSPQQYLPLAAFCAGDSLSGVGGSTR